MRHTSVPAEVIVWQCLRSRQLNGFKFRRQEVISEFIADFVCVEARLIIELDGDSHSNREIADAVRTRKLNLMGYAVERFSNVDVFEHLDGVLEEILKECERRTHTTPSP